jgi:phage gp46-like protein
MITDNGMSAVSASKTERLTQKRKGRIMSNIYTIHPKKSDLILFYEVVEPDGDNTWGGANAQQAIQWLVNSPTGSRILVSAWDSDEEDAHLVGQTLDITEIVKAASL